MRAIQRDAYGAATVLSVEEIPRPVVGPGEVLLKVHGSSVNMGDRLMLAGVPYVLRLMLGLFRPRKRGMGQDVAGRVEAVGSEVTEWGPGDAVYGEITFGQTWADYAVAPAASLARAPTSVPLARAGALPVAAVTALEAVRRHGQVTAGQKVLVNGGSGSVGSYVIQIARALGAEVTAVCSERNGDRARALGAAHVIDYAREDFTKSEARYDVLLDVAGSRSFRENLSVLTPDGTYVVIGGPISGPWLQPILRPLALMVRGLFVSQRVVVFVNAPTRANLEALTALVDGGSVVPVYASECELADLPGAMADLEAGQRHGKVSIVAAGGAAGDAPPAV